MQSKMFVIPLPSKDPTETSLYPFAMLIIETKKSGDAVPIEIMLVPSAKDEMCNFFAIPKAPLKKTSPEAMISTKKTAINKKFIIIYCINI